MSESSVVEFMAVARFELRRHRWRPSVKRKPFSKLIPINGSLFNSPTYTSFVCPSQTISAAKTLKNVEASVSKHSVRFLAQERPSEAIIFGGKVSQPLKPVSTSAAHRVLATTLRRALLPESPVLDLRQRLH